VPGTSERSEQVARESRRRARLGVPAFAAGFLYLLSSIILSSALMGAPTVGLLQGLGPALRGESNPSVSQHTAEVKFVSHKTIGLVGGAVLGAIAICLLTVVLLFLFDAVRFRRDQTWRPGGQFALIGGVGLAALNLVHSILLAIETHNFAVGHNFTNEAADRALLSKGSANVILGSLGLFAALALAAGMIAIMMGSMRAGLLPRWMSILGIVAGLLFLPLFGTGTLQLIPAFWLVGMGVLLLGKWPNGDPPAWAAGEAVPWPSQAEMRAAKRGEEAKPAPSGKPGAIATGDVAPAPAQPAPSRSSRKRGRKRRTRG
jgi:hypothetical protein